MSFEKDMTDADSAGEAIVQKLWEELRPVPGWETIIAFHRQQFVAQAQAILALLEQTKPRMLRAIALVDQYQAHLRDEGGSAEPLEPLSQRLAQIQKGVALCRSLFRWVRALDALSATLSREEGDAREN